MSKNNEFGYKVAGSIRQHLEEHHGWGGGSLLDSPTGLLQYLHDEEHRLDDPFDNNNVTSEQREHIYGLPHEAAKREEDLMPDAYSLSDSISYPDITKICERLVLAAIGYRNENGDWIAKNVDDYVDTGRPGLNDPVPDPRPLPEGHRWDFSIPDMRIMTTLSEPMFEEKSDSESGASHNSEDSPYVLQLGPHNFSDLELDQPLPWKKSSLEDSISYPDLHMKPSDIGIPTYNEHTSSSFKKEVKNLVNKFYDAGWSLQQRGTNILARCPCGEHAQMLHATPSSPRTLAAYAQALKRCPQSKLSYNKYAILEDLADEGVGPVISGGAMGPQDLTENANDLESDDKRLPDSGAKTPGTQQGQDYVPYADGAFKGWTSAW